MVDGLVDSIAEDVDFARINVTEDASEDLRRRHQIRALPTFILLDARGAVIHRQSGGSPEVATIHHALASSS